MIMNQANIPDEFLCPITRAIMRDPVMKRCGSSFERAGILSWLFDHNNSCPLTRERLSPRDLVPNHALRFRILCWLQQHGTELDTTSDSGESDGIDDYVNDTQNKNLDTIICTCLVSSFEKEKAMKKEVAPANPSHLSARSIMLSMQTRRFARDKRAW